MHIVHKVSVTTYISFILLTLFRLLTMFLDRYCISSKSHRTGPWNKSRHDEISKKLIIQKYIIAIYGISNAGKTTTKDSSTEIKRTHVNIEDTQPGNQWPGVHAYGEIGLI